MGISAVGVWISMLAVLASAQPLGWQAQAVDANSLLQAWMHRVDDAIEGNLTAEAVDSDEEEALTGEYAIASYSNQACSARHAGHIRSRQRITATTAAGCFNVFNSGKSKHDLGDGSFKLECAHGSSEKVYQRVYTKRDCQGSFGSTRKVNWKLFQGECANQQRLLPALQKSHYPACKMSKADQKRATEESLASAPLADVHILGSLAEVDSISANNTKAEEGSISADSTKAAEADSISANNTKAAAPPPPKPAEKPPTPPAPAEAAAKSAVVTATKPAARREMDANPGLEAFRAGGFGRDQDTEQLRREYVSKKAEALEQAEAAAQQPSQQGKNETLQSLHQDQAAQRASNPMIGWTEAAAWHSMFDENASVLAGDNTSVLADLLKLPAPASNLVSTGANRTGQTPNGTFQQPAMQSPMASSPMMPGAPQPQALGQIRQNATAQGAPQPQALGAIRQNATSGLQQDMGVVIEADRIAKEGMRKYNRKAQRGQAPQEEAKPGSTRNKALVQKERKQSGREAMTEEAMIREETKNVKDALKEQRDAALTTIKEESILNKDEKRIGKRVVKAEKEIIKAVNKESKFVEKTGKDLMNDTMKVVKALKDADAAVKAEQKDKEKDDIENALTDSIDALGADEEDLAESSDLTMVKFRDGAKTFEIEFVRNTPVRDVKVLAEAQSSVKADKMQLKINGRVLQDTDKLDESMQEVDITASP